MLSKKLLGMHACLYAVRWSIQYGDDAQKAWSECERGDWMLWFLGKLAVRVGSKARKKLVLVCAEIARTMLDVFEKSNPGDLLIRKTIDSAEDYARSIRGATIRKLRTYSKELLDADTEHARVFASSSDAHLAAYCLAQLAYSKGPHILAGEVAFYSYPSTPFKEAADIVRRHYPLFPLPRDAATVSS